VIPLSFLVLGLQKSCGVKTSQEHGSSFGIFPITTKAQLPAIRKNEQPLLLRKSKTDRLG